MFSALLSQPLLVIILVLAIGLVFSLAIPFHRTVLVRMTSLVVSMLALLVGRLTILPQYNLSFAVGVDGLSLIFILLTLFIFPVCFLAS
jgi:hypothetical protein